MTPVDTIATPLITKRTVAGEVAQCVRTWRNYIPGLELVAHYDVGREAIYVDYIKVPVNERRKGYCSQILEEFKMLADVFNVPVFIEPDDSFGTARGKLEELYSSCGFMTVSGGWMQYMP